MIRVDALNGSKIHASFVEETLRLGVPHALHLTVNNLRRIEPEPSLPDALTDLARYRRLLTELMPRGLVLRSQQDWDLLAEGGKVGFLLGYQNASFVGERLETLELLHDLGVRVLQITHNGQNPYGSGCAVTDDGGLTDLGREFVVACNQVGIVLDCSHTGDLTTIQVAEASTEPVLITHANPSAVLPHRRNRSDEAMRAVAQTGGVVGLTFLPALVSTSEQPALGEAARHVVHAYQLLGESAIGFGSDFTVGQVHEGRYAALDGYANVSVTSHWNYPIDGLAGMNELAEALHADLPPAAIDGFLGTNFVRVFRAAAKNSDRLQEAPA